MIGMIIRISAEEFPCERGSIIGRCFRVAPGITPIEPCHHAVFLLLKGADRNRHDDLCDAPQWEARDGATPYALMASLGSREALTPCRP